LFSGLPQGDLEGLAKVTVQHSYSRGDVIVREGDAGDAFYIITRGRVDVVRGQGTAGERVIATLGPGSFFGEMALFDEEVRSATVQAKDYVDCLVLPKSDFDTQLMAGDGRLAKSMLAVLARRIRGLQMAGSI
jgi:CRP-like cAMP-binding protein